MHYEPARVPDPSLLARSELEKSRFAGMVPTKLFERVIHNGTIRSRMVFDHPGMDPPAKEYDLRVIYTNVEEIESQPLQAWPYSPAANGRNRSASARHRSTSEVASLALRHQLVVLQRRIERTQSTETDRTILTLLAGVFDRKRLVEVFLIVQPATATSRWHQRLVTRHWTQPPTTKRGRPAIYPGIRTVDHQTPRREP